MTGFEFCSCHRCAVNKLGPGSSVTGKACRKDSGPGQLPGVTGRGPVVPALRPINRTSIGLARSWSSQPRLKILGILGNSRHLFSDAGVSMVMALRNLSVTDMCRKNSLMILMSLIALSAHAQSVEQHAEDPTPMLAFKLLIRSTQPTFSPGEPLKLEVACVSIPKLASPEWQERWNQACSSVKLETEEARIAGYWGGVGLIAWLQNNLHFCLLPPGEEYEEPFHFEYTKPQWRELTIPAQKLSGLWGMVYINAEVSQPSLQFAQAVTAIVSNADDDSEAGLDGDILIDAAAVQSGAVGRSQRLANELLEVANGGALRMAVRLFDYTPRTADLWTVIESSPHQREAIELMEARLKDADFVPGYDLLVSLTGMKARFDQPLELAAEDGQPYREYHPDLEKAALAYFRELLQALVASSGDPRSARAIAIREIAESLTESDTCPLGTYGLSSSEAAAIETKLAEK
jgi:hypothetical protein